MEISDEDQKSLLKVLLRDIDHISDEDYQKRVWIEATGPECSDYGEAMDFFLNEDSGIIDNYIIYGITEKQYQLLKKLREEIVAFDDNPGRALMPKEFLNTPEWKHIMATASQVLKAFNFQRK